MQQRFLLQILLLAQHVSGTTMPIIRSSRALELLMMGIVVPEHVEQAVRSAKKTLLHLVGILFPHINDDAWSKSHQISIFPY